MLKVLITSNVVLCGGPTAPTIDYVQRWRPVRSSCGLEPHARMQLLLPRKSGNQRDERGDKDCHQLY
jgi:hypothetical protein